MYLGATGPRKHVISVWFCSAMSLTQSPASEEASRLNPNCAVFAQRRTGRQLAGEPRAEA
jgi:hypothetical protein